MKHLSLAAAAALSMLICSCNADTQHFPKAENFGSLGEGVQEYLQDIRDLGGTYELNSIMVIKDGKVLEEYYDCCYGPDFLNICWSASKTFTATAVGFAVQDGLLDIHDKVVDRLPANMLPEHISDTLASLDIYNLLRMASGLSIDPIGPTGSGKLKESTKTVLEAGFKYFPGEKYSYNSHNTYLLSVIVSLTTGKPLHEYLQEKLFTPLGIRRYHWDQSAEGFDCGGWGLYITTESLAKMGQFFLQKGQWKGKQLLDKEWIEAAMSPQIYQRGGQKVEGDDWGLGYGYQMWCCEHGAARLDGAHGQWSVICPEKNAVIVITENIGNTHVAFKSMWSRIYDRI